MEQFKNGKYLKNYKSFSNGYGKVSDWNPNKPFKINELIQVSVYHEKYSDMKGHIAAPKKMKDDVDYSKKVYVKFEDGKEDYIETSEIKRI